MANIGDKQAGQFTFEITDQDSQPIILRWATLDRISGETKAVSEPLVGIQTIDGERFSLVPSDTNPFLIVRDGGGDCFYGNLVNYPTIKPEEHFKTLSVASVTTADGEVIDTLLALRRAPYKGPEPVSIPPGLFGQIMAEMLGDHIREENDIGTEDPKPGEPKKIVRTRKPPAADA